MPLKTPVARLARRRKSRLAGRAAGLKWFSVLAALLIATAIDGISNFESNQRAREIALTGQAIATQANDSRPDLVHEVSATGSIDASDRSSDMATPICPTLPDSDPLKS